MAFELSFAPEFFIGPHDLEGGEFDKKRPTSVYQALMAMRDDEWQELCDTVFDSGPMEVSDVMNKIRETNTCTNLSSPVEVWIDAEGWHRVEVYDGTYAEGHECD